MAKVIRASISCAGRGKTEEEALDNLTFELFELWQNLEFHGSEGVVYDEVEDEDADK
jgi:predicted RNase H-like HicB family nuclease